MVSALNAGALGQGTKIPQAVRQRKKKERKKRKEKKELTGCVMAGVTGVGMGRGGQQLQEMREERSPSGWGA